MTKIPIIIFHIGNQKYLELVINQAHKYNNEVILIGDEHNKHLCENHYNYNKTQNHYNTDFTKYYKHISPNNEPFEKICIERWICILNIMKSQNIEKSFICDSDVLVYCDVDNLIQNDYKDDLYISTTTTKKKVTAGQSIWTLNKLQEFVDFIINFYKNSDWEYISSYWDSYTEKLTGGISDMYVLYCFLTKTTFADNHFAFKTELLSKKYDLSQVVENRFFDNSIDLDSDVFGINKWDQEFHEFNIPNIENKIKKIQWKNNTPYCLNKNSNTPVQVNSLHFHGCKQLIEKYMTPPTISSVLFSLNDNYTIDNKERFIICMNYMLECVDEIVYIDWGSPDGVSLLELDFVKHNIKHYEKIRHLKFSREQISRIVPEGKHFIQHSIIRNIGIREAKGDYIISTNVDIIFPKREDLDSIIKINDAQTFYSINRKNIDMLMTTAIYNNAKDKLRDIMSNFIQFRQTPRDINPIETFKKEATEQVDINSELYKSYITYAKIWNCGDFQMAHRDIWHKIRGFEENMLDGAMGTDSNIHKKICNYGYNLKILNKPDIFHMNHPARSSHGNKKMCDMNRFLINFQKTENDENWGLYNKIKNNIPLISVVIPTYNRFKYLLNTIGSVKEQTYKNIEIIVVNDCSTETEYYNYNWAQNGVNIIHLPENSKTKFGFACGGFVRNQGIKISKGKYIAFCDDDDIWFPQKIELQIEAMKRTGCKMSSTDGLIGKGVYNINKKYKKYKKYNAQHYYTTLQNIYKHNDSKLLEKGFPDIWDLNFIKIHNCIITSSVILEKTILDKINNFKNTLNSCEDYDCWLRVLQHTNSVYVKDTCFYYDDGHANSAGEWVANKTEIENFK